MATGHPGKEAGEGKGLLCSWEMDFLRFAPGFPGDGKTEGAGKAVCYALYPGKEAGRNFRLILLPRGIRKRASSPRQAKEFD